MTRPLSLQLPPLHGDTEDTGEQGKRAPTRHDLKPLVGPRLPATPAGGRYKALAGELSVFGLWALTTVESIRQAERTPDHKRLARVASLCELAFTALMEFDKCEAKLAEAQKHITNLRNALAEQFDEKTVRRPPSEPPADDVHQRPTAVMTAAPCPHCGR